MSNIKYQFISMFITSEFYSDIGSADFSRLAIPALSSASLFLPL